MRRPARSPPSQSGARPRGRHGGDAGFVGRPPGRPVAQQQARQGQRAFLVGSQRRQIDRLPQGRLAAVQVAVRQPGEAEAQLREGGVRVRRHGDLGLVQGGGDVAGQPQRLRQVAARLQQVRTQGQGRAVAGDGVVQPVHEGLGLKKLGVERFGTAECDDGGLVAVLAVQGQAKVREVAGVVRV